MVVILCFAHLAGAMSLKNGGRKGLVYFSNLRLNPNIELNSSKGMYYIRLNTKIKILQIAHKLFAEKGKNGVGVREIAKAADVNVAAINYHLRFYDEAN